MDRTVIALLTAPGFLGVLLGLGAAPTYRVFKAEVVVLWHTFSRACALRHIKQTTLDDAALKMIDKARPAITRALDDAQAGLIAERLTSAAMEADTTPQTASLMPKPVEAETLPAPTMETTTVATVSTVAQTTVAAP